MQLLFIFTIFTLPHTRTYLLCISCWETIGMITRNPHDYYPSLWLDFSIVPAKFIAETTTKMSHSTPVHHYFMQIICVPSSDWEKFHTRISTVTWRIIEYFMLLLHINYTKKLSFSLWIVKIQKVLQYLSDSRSLYVVS